MKRILTSMLALALVLTVFLGVLPVSAERYVWEDGKLPANWKAIAKEDITATDILGPVNPKASQEAKNLYAYLCTLTDSNRFLTGQFDLNNNDSVWKKVKEQQGFEPALYSAHYSMNYGDAVWGSDIPGDPGYTEIVNDTATIRTKNETNALLKKHYDNGNVLLVHADRSYRDPTINLLLKKKVYIDVMRMIQEFDKTNPDRDMQAYAIWCRHQDSIIEALQELEDSGVKAYMYRDLVEFNLHGFFIQPAAFTRVFQQEVQRFLDSDLTGYLFTYSPGATSDTSAYNPGNEYVDIYSVTMYSEDGDMGHFSGDSMANYSWYMKTGKPIGCSEFSCRRGQSDLVGRQARSSWFTSLKDVITYYPGISWVNCWGDAAYSLIEESGGGNGNDDAVLFLDSPYTINLDELPDYRNTNFAAPGIAQLYTAADGNSAYVGLEERAYTASDLQKAGIKLADIRALRINTGYGITFYESDDCSGEGYSYGVSKKNLPAKFMGTVKSLVVAPQGNMALDKEMIFAGDNDADAWKANDGNTSAWVGHTDPQTGEVWISVDLDEVCTITSYGVKTAAFASQAAMYNVKDFRLEYSDDGENWKVIDTVKDNTKGEVRRYINTVNAQHFRLVVTGANSSVLQEDKTQVIIAEFELFGMPYTQAAPDYPEGTGLFKVDGEWLYIENGQWRSDYCGFVKHTASNTWFYVTDGKIDWNLEGAFKHPSGIWFIVKGGQIDWGYNGFYKVSGIWFYFENGQINWNLTGLFKHPSGQWFYVKNAQIDWGYTGFGKHLASNTWFYCENGTIAWSKSGAFKHPSGIWFMVNGGQIDWKYNGFYKVSGIWFYFENGQINWNLTGLYKLPSANAWFYVKNAQIDWSYNGKATKNGVTFNVRNGQVIF